MEVQILNGATNRVNLGRYDYPMNGATSRVTMNGATSSIAGNMNGATSRVGVMNGASQIEAYDPSYMDLAEYQRYVIGALAGEPIAMNGIFDRFRERRAERREARQQRRQERRDRRARRSEARTQDLESGRGFWQRAGGFLQNFGESQRINADAQRIMADQGLPFDPTMGVEMIAAIEGGGLDSGGGLNQWWANNKSWAQPVGLGLAGLTAAVIVYKTMFQKNKKRRRR